MACSHDLHYVYLHILIKTTFHNNTFVSIFNTITDLASQITRWKNCTFNITAEHNVKSGRSQVLHYTLQHWAVEHQCLVSTCPPESTRMFQSWLPQSKPEQPGISMVPTDQSFNLSRSNPLKQSSSFISRNFKAMATQPNQFLSAYYICCSFLLNLPPNTLWTLAFNVALWFYESKFSHLLKMEVENCAISAACLSQSLLPCCSKQLDTNF